MSEQQPKKRGFASMSPERLREIASAGGKARKVAWDTKQQSRTPKGSGGVRPK